MFLRRVIGDIRRTRKMYMFFEEARNKNKQPLKIMKFWELYKAVRTR